MEVGENPTGTASPCFGSPIRLARKGADALIDQIVRTASCDLLGRMKPKARHQIHKNQQFIEHAGK